MDSAHCVVSTTVLRCLADSVNRGPLVPTVLRPQCS
jgi:hypothetical protein